MKDIIEIIGKHSVNMQQRRGEFALFCHWIKHNNIRNYLEIGLNKGGTFAALNEIFNFDVCCGIEIDPLKLRIPPDPNMKFYFGDCRDKEAVFWALDNAPFDLIFIDGSHKYEAVKRDFELYAPLGRFIALHDTNKYEGVKQFWDELTRRKIFLTELADRSKALGIGIVKGDCL